MATVVTLGNGVDVEGFGRNNHTTIPPPMQTNIAANTPMIHGSQARCGAFSDAPQDMQKALGEFTAAPQRLQIIGWVVKARPQFMQNALDGLLGV
jgi:hypothetical protein